MFCFQCNFVYSFDFTCHNNKNSSLIDITRPLTGTRLDIEFSVNWTIVIHPAVHFMDVPSVSAKFANSLAICGAESQIHENQPTPFLFTNILQYLQHI